MKLERSLSSLDKEKETLKLQDTGHYERTCELFKKKYASRLSSIAKQYLYHKPNPYIKEPVQAIKVEEQKHIASRSTIVQRVSPFKNMSGTDLTLR